MAMILEVVDAGGVRTRLRLDALPLTVGRGYGNDLILDDPYVDPRHARIGVDEAGALVVEDLGSVNGLAAPGSRVRTARIAAGPGTEVRLGRTVLRFRHPDDTVPPALPDPGEDGEPSPAPAPWPTSRWVRLGVPAAAVAAVSAQGWLASYERSSASEVLGGALAFAFFVAAWAGIWAVAGRVAGQRFHFLGHVAVASAAVLAGMAGGIGEGWASFLFPDNPLPSLLVAAAWLGLAAALVAGHLALASTLPRGRRWRAGLATSVVILAVGAATTLAGDDAFSDVPEFAGVLKPVPARLVPTTTPAGFERVAAELREEVDALATEE